MPEKSLQPPLPRDEQKQRTRNLMIDVLLQGIIAANPHHDDTVTAETRMAQAREALFGEKPVRGRKAIHEDVKLFPLIEEALKAETDKMKRALVGVQQPQTQTEWQRELDEDQKSMRAIAKAHVPSFAKPTTAENSTVDWLRRALAKLDVTQRDMVELEGLLYGNSPKAERLQRIFEDMKGLGIDVVNPFGTETTDMTPKQD